MGLTSLHGKTCSARVGKRATTVVVFDWDKLKQRATFLDDIFGDCDLPGDFPTLLGVQRGRTAWIGDVVPFALAGIEPEHTGGFTGGDDYPQFDRLLLIAPSGRGPVYGIDVDGTAMPAKKPAKIAASLAALTLAPVVVKKAKAPGTAAAPDFSERETLRDVHGGVEVERIISAGKLLERLTGIGERRRGKPPKDRDPRWIDALREELLAAVRASSQMRQGGPVYILTAALTTFGAEGVRAAESVDAEVRKQKHADGIQYGLPYLRETLEDA